MLDDNTISFVSARETVVLTELNLLEVTPNSLEATGNEWWFWNERCRAMSVHLQRPQWDRQRKSGLFP